MVEQRQPDGQRAAAVAPAGKECAEKSADATKAERGGAECAGHVALVGRGGAPAGTEAHAHTAAGTRAGAGAGTAPAPAPREGQAGALPASMALSARRILWLTAGAVPAVGAVGFFGYAAVAGEQAAGWVRWLDARLMEPWPVFLWWCGALFAVQRAILDKRGVQRARRRADVALLASAGAVFALRYLNWGPALGRLIRRIIPHIEPEKTIIAHSLGRSWFWTSLWLLMVFGLGLLAVFRILHWREARREERPTGTQLWAGMCLVGGVCAALLSWLLRFDVLGPLLRGLLWFLPLTGTPLPDAATDLGHMQPFNPCSVTFAGTCPPPMLTLSFLNALLATALLAGAALLVAAGMLEGPAERAPEVPEVPEGAPVRGVWRGELGGLLATLAWALRPIGKLGFFGWVARVAWPLGTLAAVVCGAALADALQRALHAPRDLSDPLGSMARHFARMELPVMGWALLSLLCALLGVWLLTTNGRLARESLDFAALLCIALLPALGIFAVGFWLLNRLVLLALGNAGWIGTVVPEGHLHPFDLGPVTLVTLATLLVVGVPALAAQMMLLREAARRRAARVWWLRWLARRPRAKGA